MCVSVVGRRNFQINVLALNDGGRKGAGIFIFFSNFLADFVNLGQGNNSAVIPSLNPAHGNLVQRILKIEISGFGGDVLLMEIFIDPVFVFKS